MDGLAGITHQHFFLQALFGKCAVRFGLVQIMLQNLFLSEYTGAKPGGRVAVLQQLHVMDELKTDEAIWNAVYSSSMKLKMSIIKPVSGVVLNNALGSFDGLNKWASLSRSTPPPEKSKDLGWTFRTIAMI